MTRPTRLLTAIEYSSAGDALEATADPQWPAVEEAIRRRDAFCFPIVPLQLTPDDDDDQSSNVIGGNGRGARLPFIGVWQYVDPVGSEATPGYGKATRATSGWHPTSSATSGKFCASFAANSRRAAMPTSIA